MSYKPKRHMETVLIVIAMAAVLAAVATFPLTWMIMLALGNFGHAQYGFIDVLPLGVALMIFVGMVKAESK